MLPSILARLRAYLLDLSIKNRLIVSLLTAIALPIITLTLYHAIAERHYLMERDLEAMRSHAREVAGQIDTIIDSNAATVRHMAMAWRLQYFFATRDYGGPWRASLQAWLDEQLKISPDYAALYALDLTGACIISSDRTFVGQNYSVRPYFKEALKGAHYISDWSIGLTSGVPGVYFSAPVRYNGAIVGIAVLKMKTDRITRIIDEFSDASSAAYLLNGMGIVLAHRNRELLYRSLGDLAPDERRCIEESQQFANRTIVSAGLPSMRDDHRGLLRAGERVAISRIYRLDGSDKVSAIARLRHLEWTVGISKHLSSVYGPAHRQIAIALVIALLSMGLGYIAGQAITRGITRPLSHLVDAVDAFGKGEWAIRAPVYAGDELGGLATTFNEMASALGKHTNNLEALVAERTGELQAKNEKVLSQQKDLQRRNDLIEAELSIARKIQFRLIPTEKIEGAHFHYRPMDKVGGDFFDFVRFRDRDKLGVFISDVSGHGVPAAFITAIVKSLVLQAGSRKDDPAALLKYLNDVLLGMTGDNFVTAFYAVYDRGTRALRYANAGHNPPYLIINGSFVRLESTTGPPVAIFSNERLARANKEYETNEIAIQERGKLLLYTDGVTEAVCKPSPGPMFGDGHFERAIEKHADLPSDELIEALYGELVGFRGGDSFEDDVCLVCIDV